MIMSTPQWGAMTFSEGHAGWVRFASNFSQSFQRGEEIGQSRNVAYRPPLNMLTEMGGFILIYLSFIREVLRWR